MRPLTEEQKREATLIASVGCDRESAAKYIGATIADIEDATRRDPAFGDELRRAEAGCELAHMRNIQQAAREDKHWRASVWWLERRVPERYARREAGSVSRRELIRFLGEVANGIAATVRTEEDRQRVLDKLGELAEKLNDPLLLEAAPEPQETEPPAVVDEEAP